MRPEIIPAILTTTLEDYLAKLEVLEGTEAAWVHVDVMDGQFVPNITVMPHEIMDHPTRLSLEVHVMAFRPERYFPDLTAAGAKRVLLHREAYQSLEECAVALRHAADYFPEVGLAVNPDTALEPYAGLTLHSLQIMGVHPGASGQAFLEQTYVRVKEAAGQKLSAVLAVDGGVGEDTIAGLRKAGASRLVINSQLFAQKDVRRGLTYFNQLMLGGA